MTVGYRIAAIRLMEMINRNKKLANYLELSAELKQRKYTAEEK